MPISPCASTARPCRHRITRWSTGGLVGIGFCGLPVIASRMSIPGGAHTAQYHPGSVGFSLVQIIRRLSFHRKANPGQSHLNNYWLIASSKCRNRYGPIPPGLKAGALVVQVPLVERAPDELNLEVGQSSDHVVQLSVFR